MSQMLSNSVYSQLRKLGLLLFIGQSLHAGQITVSVDFGAKGSAIKFQTEYEKGESALKVLKKVTKVGLKKIGDYTFVTSINGIKSAPGVIGWFYTLDGQKAKKLASTTFLDGTKRMHWSLETQACIR